MRPAERLVVQNVCLSPRWHLFLTVWHLGDKEQTYLHLQTKQHEKSGDFLKFARRLRLLAGR